MISVKDAKKSIEVGTSYLKIKKIKLSDSVGYSNVNDILSPIDFPYFNQSAMDGYGIFFNPENKEYIYNITGIEQAGNTSIENSIKNKEAIRIFTGAKIPFGVNAVVQQEWVIKNGDKIEINNHEIKVGMNIRLQASQCKKNEMILKKGSVINAGTVSLLAGVGIESIDVYSKPNISIINTGKELVNVGSILQGAQIFESNSFGLIHALKSIHIDVKEVIKVDDDMDELKDVIQQALSVCDLLIITGGVSVGDYDFVPQALTENGVEKIFHKIKQKPGKPLFFGKKENKIIFGLPGNPASVLTCFYQYVFPCIKKMMGFNEKELLKIKLPCLNKYEKKAGLTHFLKAKINFEGVEILDHQESYKMNSFAMANAMIEIEEEKIKVEINELVNTYILV